MELVFKSIYKQGAAYGGQLILAGGAVIRSISCSMDLKWATNMDFDFFAVGFRCVNPRTHQPMHSPCLPHVPPHPPP